MESLSAAASYALRFVNQTNRSLFLTGKAGTGKTTLLREIIRTTHKNVVVVAPTGIAALNAGGVTIHSMFQLPFAAFVPDTNLPFSNSGTVKFETRDSLRRHFRMRYDKQQVIQNLELLVIDEVSMLRADLLDAMDYMLRTVRRKNAPFGGVQVLYIGDLLQLPPVIKNEEWEVLRQYYNGKFFFHSHAVAQDPPLYIELTHIYRQSDARFINVLNNLRNNVVTHQDLSVLNGFVKPGFVPPQDGGFITLTTHNAKADAMNARALETLVAEEHVYIPDIVDDFPDKIFPVEHDLKLKVGAQVMFIKNDLSPEKRYFNGKIGVIHSLADGEVLVRFPDEGTTIEAEKYEWQNIRYYVDDATKEVREEVLGTFTHYPLRLAWAITVHKSQGLTFDRAILDVTNVFMPGQAYVALSRLRSLEGLILLSPMQMNGIASDADVIGYASARADEATLETSLKDETLRFVKNYLINGFSFQELAQLWQKHRVGYLQEGEKSSKNAYRQWAQKQEDAIHTLLDASQKFGLQLERLFSASPIDMAFVKERVEAAYHYFFPVLDRMETALLHTMEEVRRQRRAKGFYDELAELEEFHTAGVLHVMKARQMAVIAAEGEDISKENLITPTIRSYRTAKLEAIREIQKQNPVTIIEEDYEDYTPQRKLKGKKEPKKSTYEETFDLWKQRLSIEDIAAQRKLTPTTIFSHLAKIIESGKIMVDEVLTVDRLKALEEAFSGYTEESLSPLKEKVGDAFTWGELRLYRASQLAATKD